ncbi:tetratricopeptide repeat protein [Sphingomonas sp. CL5.1]|uniref:SPOR domain-containing protein n=1 Tax=Sphingomonas sp. CL5.1 TaxID=2653203 RepID=UPI001582E57C|nr:tetratricopeptide repeat protein [Sphingomonas sp. CL5.1]QKS01817.1 tetratricopeptide repeat protein [Sphingomonas sp. CL5.1]
MKRTISLAFLALASATALPALAAPQMVQPLPQAGSDADQLAAAMRTVGANPRDLNALIEAGELSLKLGDASGAAALFKRADEIDPMNGRVKAGMARILVQQERPGEALRYFDQAAGYGLDPRSFAGDRGLAYDLIGEQERAQRDYRLALKAGPQDEVQRRYALSLAISGRQEEALKEIEPLLRGGDRGAWRARAFILAMGGDVAGAEKIATTMMPGGMASGLAPFFQRLPSLAPVDKAFAVHFGEVRASAARLADARLTPSLPPLGPDAGAPVRVATVTPPATPPVVETARNRRDRSRGKPAAPVAVAAAATSVPSPAAEPLPQPPSYPGKGVVFAAPSEVTQKLPPRAPYQAVPASEAAQKPLPPIEVASVTNPPPAPVEPPRPRRSSRRAPPKGGEDSILAKIIAGIAVPESEMTEARPPEKKVETVATRRKARAEEAVETADATPPKRGRGKAGAKTEEPAETADATPPRHGRGKASARAEETDADEAKPKKLTAAQKKAEEAKKLAATKKAEEAKKAAEERKAAKAEPARIWVQVAGGANEEDLPKAWAAVKGKTATLAGKHAYTTRLRATNRVVTGPFKTEAEARAMVNKLAKEGVSAFTFTSNAGQKMTKIEGK